MTAAAYNGGVTSYEAGPDSPLSTEIDWESIDTAEGRAVAIINKFGGTLTMADTAKTPEVYQNQYADFLKSIIDDDALFEKFMGNAVPSGSEKELIERMGL